MHTNDANVITITMTTIATHSGSFHADDIFAVAVLKLVLGDDAEVIRTRNEEEIRKADYAVDVGGIYDPEANRFDHHQTEGAGERENGIPYASFGLVWKHYGVGVSGAEEIARRIEEDLVEPIDAGDNGVSLCSPRISGRDQYVLQDIVALFRPTWSESDDLYDTRFLELVGWAKRLLIREIQAKKDLIQGEERIEEAYQSAEDKRIIILKKSYPWQKYLVQKTEPIFVVEPSSSGDRWDAEAALRSKDSWFERRMYFPEKWAGKRGKELQKASGVRDAIFAHRGKFFVSAESREGAIALARKAFKQAESPSSP